MAAIAAPFAARYGSGVVVLNGSGSMYGKAVLMALAAGACSHPGPARASGVECHSAANAKAIAGLSASQACALVRERVQAAAAGADVTIELDLSRAGSAIARVRAMQGGRPRAYPDIAVDVMDRPLGREDLVRLGDTIAGALASGPQPE